MVSQVRAAYSAASTAAGVAETIGKERMSGLQKLHESHIKLLRVEHNTAIDTLEVKQNAAIDSLTLKHDAAIQALTAKLDHTTEMFNFKLSSAENRVAVLKQEMSLASHGHIQSSSLPNSVVQGMFYSPQFITSEANNAHRIYQPSSHMENRNHSWP